MKTLSQSILLAGALVIQTSASTLLSDWNAALNAGLTATKGNTETSLLTTTFKFSRKIAKSEYNGAFAYSLGKDNGDVIADELTGFLNWNKLLEGDSYHGIRLEGRKDNIADIDYRLQSTYIYGLYFIKNETTTLGLEGGPGYTLASISDDSDNSSHLYLGQKFTHNLSKNAKLFQSSAFYFSLEDLGKFNTILTLGAEAKLTEKLSIQFTLENKYESDPASGAENNDIKLISGLGYSF